MSSSMRLCAIVALACAAPGAGWVHGGAPAIARSARLAARGEPRRAPRAPYSHRAAARTAGNVQSIGLRSGRESLRAGERSEAERSLEAASGSPSELSWERAVARFGLLPRALLKLRKREEWVGRRLGAVPGVLMVRRSSQIWGFLSAVVIKRALSSTLPGSPSDERRLARECKEGLIMLGPTFIKLGQLLSTRIDVMPQAFIEELASLQDQCPPFPLEQVHAIVERELGPGAFRSFDPTPLAAASLGQVHLATTRDGTRVCVKVQRPGLEELFRVDLKNLQVLSELAMQLDRTPDRVLRDWREIFAQNARIIYEEIDYRQEARNALEFAENFAAVPWLRVPKVYPDYTTSRVLTMEYAPGTKVNALREIDALGLNRPQLAQYAAEAYLLQLLRFGFFHCDPHPGNVAVEPIPGGEPGAGRIILYDYGMVGRLSPQLKAGLVKGFFAVYERDPPSLAQALYDAGLIGEDTDRLSVEMISRYFIETFSKRFAMDKRSAPADRGERDRMRVAAMQSIGQELAAIGGSNPFRYPEAFPSILRAFTVLEGIGKTLDTQYDVYRIARKYIPELADLKDGSALLTAVRDVQKRLGLRGQDLVGLVDFPRKITGLQTFAQRVERGELKLRVRTLEVERALFRAALLQSATLWTVLGCALLNAGMFSLLIAGRRVVGVLEVFGGGFAYCAVRVALCLLKLRQVLRDESNKYYNGYLA